MLRGFVLILESKFSKCNPEGFILVMKYESIVDLQSGSGHSYWNLDLEVEVHSLWVLCTRQTFKNIKTMSFRRVA